MERNKKNLGTESGIQWVSQGNLSRMDVCCHASLDLYPLVERGLLYYEITLQPLFRLARHV